MAKIKKLTLTRETLRKLTSDQLRRVVGGTAETEPEWTCGGYTCECTEPEGCSNYCEEDDDTGTACPDTFPTVCSPWCTVDC